MLFAGVTVGTGDVGIGVGDGISGVVPDPLIWRLIPVTPCTPLPIPGPFPTSTSGAAASVAGIAIPFFVLAIRYAPLRATSLLSRVRDAPSRLVTTIG